MKISLYSPSSAAVISSIAILVFLIFGEDLIMLYLMGEGEVENIEMSLKYGKEYFFIMLFSFIPYAFMQCYSSTLRESGETMVPMKAGVIAVLVNLVLNAVFIFGLLGAVLGTYGAGQNYGCYPVLSFDNVVSGITHSISGFASLYIAISGMSSMKKKNIPITFAILFSFCIAALSANAILDYNYMFLRRGDGTPYDIFYNLVGGNQILYPMVVILLFVLYIVVFHYVYDLCKNGKKKEACVEQAS